jgi:hypothetical protein
MRQAQGISRRSPVGGLEITHRVDGLDVLSLALSANVREDARLIAS